MKILMVCLGNICRSPLAEGILRQKIAQQGLNWEVASAGTGSWHVGSPADERSVQIAQKHQIDLSKHIARQFQAGDFDHFDHIFVMDSSNYNKVLSKTTAQRHHQKVNLIMNMAYPNENRSVPDPYYEGKEGFEIVFQMLDKACDGIIKQYRSSVG